MYHTNDTVALIERAKKSLQSVLGYHYHTDVLAESIERGLSDGDVISVRGIGEVRYIDGQIIALDGRQLPPTTTEMLEQLLAHKAGADATRAADAHHHISVGR